MKNQWFGDIHDFRKYGLLRFLGGIIQDEKEELITGFKRILVVWMLTPPVEHDNCGKYRKYVNRPKQWMKCDKDLFESLQKFNNIESSKKEYNVSNAFHPNILPCNRFFSYGEKNNIELSKNRESYFTNMKENNCDLIFLDADNGLEVKSMTEKTKPLYIMYEEVKALYTVGKSVLIYQHRAIGQSFENQIKEKKEELQLNKVLTEEERQSRLIVFRGGNVSYFLLCQTKEQKNRVYNAFNEKNYPDYFLKIHDEEQITPCPIL